MQITNIDLIGDQYVIQKGAYWSPIVFLLVGNYTTWGQFGQIRDKSGGDLYADLNFQPIILVTKSIGGVNKTCSRVRPFLTATQTKNIPATMIVKSSRPLIAGRNRWEYDVFLRHPTDHEIVLAVAQGLIEVSSTVTVIP